MEMQVVMCCTPGNTGMGLYKICAGTPRDAEIHMLILGGDSVWGCRKLCVDTLGQGAQIWGGDANIGSQISTLVNQ